MTTRDGRKKRQVQDEQPDEAIVFKKKDKKE